MFFLKRHPSPSPSRPLAALYLTTLFFSFHFFLITYVNSANLGRFASYEMVSLVFLIGSLVAIIAFLAASRLLHTLGNYRFLFFFTVLEVIASFGLAFASNFLTAAFFLILFLIGDAILFFSLDIFLEIFTPDEKLTGRRRSIVLTITNAALLLSPLIAGWVIGVSEHFSRIYILSGIFLIPALFIIRRQFSSFSDPEYQKIEIIATIKRYAREKNLLFGFFSHLFLRIFFAWMVIYTPLYLIEEVGFSWDMLGILFTIMLLPFVLFEMPIGKLADTRFGEKEFMAAGFLITASATALIPLMQTSSFFWWAALLFLTRVGASFTEITTESYFFKQTSGSDANVIGIFRLTRPLSYVISAALAGTSLLFLSFADTFFVLSLFMVAGFALSLFIQDTR
jgi:MFS family permease